jgi:alanyl-tRNA synthetase
MDLDEIVQGCAATEQLYLRNMDLKGATASITRLIPDKGQHFYIVLDKTVFHPKGGGQPSDRGRLNGVCFQVNVKKVIDSHGVLVHWVKGITGIPALGSVQCELDWENRHIIMRKHSAAHLIDHCLSKITTSHVQTTDSWLGEDSYVGYVGMLPPAESLRNVEHLANQMISDGASIKIDFLSAEEARLLRNAPNYERLPDLPQLRIVTISGCEPIPCGGTHVSDARQIGKVSLQKAHQINDHGYRLYFNVG